MKILEIITSDNNSGWKFIDDKLNQKWTPAIREKIIDAYFNISGYVRGGGGGNNNLDIAYKVMMTFLSDKVGYTGEMYRAVGLTAKDLTVPDIRLMSSKLHSWSSEFARQTVSWTTRLDITVTHLMGQPTMILHQNSSGLDIGKIDINEFGEAEILSPLSNSVSIYGFAADEKFFPVANFKEFVKYTRSIDLRDYD
jgi:hypothetical protein